MVAVARARMTSLREQLNALRDMTRTKDAPSTVSPMWRDVKCTDEGTMFPSIWREMVELHGSSGSSMAECKIQFNRFRGKVKPTIIIQMQISVLQWVQLSISTRCVTKYSDDYCLQVIETDNNACYPGMSSDVFKVSDSSLSTC